MTEYPAPPARRSSRVNLVVLVSIAFHACGAVMLDQIRPKPVEIIADVVIADVERPEPKPPEPEPEPEPVAPRAPAPAPAPAPAAPAAPAPDFGLVLGDASGPGLAVVVPAAAPAPVRQEARVLAAPKSAETCAEPEVKAKALSMPRPAYTDAARAAAIEGKVRVELTIDAAGAVTGARVVEGLGHGLDEAAIAAVQAAKFTPASRCGKPVSTTFVVAIRFAL